MTRSAEAVLEKLGLPYLNKLNGYASGGLVGAPPAAALMGGGGNV